VEVRGSEKKREMSAEEEKGRLVYVVLQQASLETVKTKRGYELLNAEDHKGLLLKAKRDPSLYRPDIVHQVLLALLDSPLNRAGHLRVFIQTWNNVLIEVNPEIRIPRTYKRFAGLMVQLLHKLTIRASEGSTKLLKVVKNPVTSHLPVGCMKIGMSTTGDLVDMNQFVRTLPEGKPIAFMMGSHAHGKCEADWVEKYVAVSQYSLSAAAASVRVTAAFESLWGVL
jgi:rRNA small subunit pseudouridine methyltransferase Nep1